MERRYERRAWCIIAVLDDQICATEYSVLWTRMDSYGLRTEYSVQYSGVKILIRDEAEFGSPE